MPVKGIPRSDPHTRHLGTSLGGVRYECGDVWAVGATKAIAFAALQKAMKERTQEKRKEDRRQKELNGD